MYSSMHQTPGRILWERNQQDVKNRLEWAFSNQRSSNMGLRANALYVLSEYYRYGWGGVQEDEKRADNYLRESAGLGHARACYEFVRKYSSRELPSCNIYIQRALSQIDNPSFNCPQVGHDQKSMEHELRVLSSILTSTLQSSPPVTPAYNSSRTPRNATATGRRVVTEDELFDIAHPGLRENLRFAALGK